MKIQMAEEQTLEAEDIFVLFERDLMIRCACVLCLLTLVGMFILKRWT